MSKSPLGRGLSSLIPNKAGESQAAGVESEAVLSGLDEQKADLIHTVRVELISLNPYQPRKEFDAEKIDSLAKSIQEKGLLQPLLVTKLASGSYELIAGERRLRAVKSLGLKTVPVIIRTQLSNKEKAEIALIENIQRQDLNPIEKAKGFLELAQRFQMTQESIASHLGLSRSSVANTLRYLQLPASVQEALQNGSITEGHAKIIAGLDSPELQEKVLKNILVESLNVRQTEKIVKRDPHQALNQVSFEVRELVKNLSETIQNKVEVRKKGKRYILTMNFFSEEEIKSLYQKIS